MSRVSQFRDLEVKSGSIEWPLALTMRRWPTVSPSAGSAAAAALLLLRRLLVAPFFIIYTEIMKTVAALSLLASASAFAPAQTGSRVRHSSSNNFRDFLVGLPAKKRRRHLLRPR